MKIIRSLMVTVGLLLALAVPSFAQTTLTSTTLAAAASATATQVRVASNSGIEVGDYMAVLARNQVAEIMTVQAINGTFITVRRGTQFPAVAHLNASTLYHAPPAQFYTTDPSPGTTCTRANELYLPHINRTSRSIAQCSTAGVWYRLNEQFTVKCWSGALATGSIDQTCWLADGNYVITQITEVHTVKETGGTLTLIVKRQQGTEAAASGDVLMTALDMAAAGTAETVRTAVLTTTGTDLLLDAGDRIGLDFTDDVAGELAGVVVTITLAPI
jgi:hypothetical protein